ncbi:MAG: hypothetical protein F6J93_38945 [Oscillatoria sp. SIO1A7]|nr:hypothetical protein [Oscillatoria sp. SIO1A7]
MNYLDLLKKCEKISFSDDAINVYVGDHETAKIFVNFTDDLSGAALNTNRRWVKIFYAGCQRPYEIPSYFAKCQQRKQSQQKQQKNMILKRIATDEVFTAPTKWNPVLYDALGKMIKGDRPMALLTPDDYQVWVNRQAANLTKDTLETAVTIKVSNYWAAEDLTALHEKIKKYGAGNPFEHTYRCELTSDGQWAIATNRYEVLKNGYRISTNLSHAFIERPEGIMVGL